MRFIKNKVIRYLLIFWWGFLLTFIVFLGIDYKSTSKKKNHTEKYWTVLCTSRKTGAPSLFTGPLPLIPSTLVVCTHFWIVTGVVFPKSTTRRNSAFGNIAITRPVRPCSRTSKDTPVGNHRVGVYTRQLRYSVLTSGTRITQPSPHVLPRYLYSFFLRHTTLFPLATVHGYARTCVRGENGDKSSLFGENKKKKTHSSVGPR